MDRLIFRLTSQKAEPKSLICVPEPLSNISNLLLWCVVSGCETMCA